MKNRNPDKETSLVYSTEHGKICPGCGHPEKKCVCSSKKQTVKGDGTVRVGFETKGRGGKGVTTISGVSADLDGLKDLGKKLKQKCGSGGTVKDGVIEIQGDVRDMLVGELVGMGMKVKRCGG